MLNEFGKVLRKLRIDRNERMLDMAQKIGKSSAFISSIERGEKPIPEGFEELIIQAYQLNVDEAANLRCATAQSKHKFVITPKSELGRDTASLMARRMDTLTPDELNNILKILMGGNTNEK